MQPRGQLSMLFHLYTANQAAWALLQQRLAPTIADSYAVMSLISVRGQQTPGALAQQLGMLPSTMTALVQRLLKRGHIVQVPHPQDGRSYLIGLTAEGDAEMRAAIPVFTQLMGEIRQELEHSPAEITAVLEDLERAIRRVRMRPTAG